MKSLVISLPVPDMNPGLQRANHQLFAAFAAARAEVRGMEDISIAGLGREAVDLLHDGAVADAIARENPDVAGFSLYVWNRDRALRVASELMTKGIPTAAGGPEAVALIADGTGSGAEGVPIPFDVVLRGEGEDAFLDLLSDAEAWKLAGASGGSNGKPRIMGSKGPVDFTAFAEAFSRGTEEYRSDGLAYLEVERGCPFGCTYCSYAKGRNVLTTMPAELFRNCVGILFEKPIEELYLLAPTLNRIPAVFRERLSILADIQRERGQPVKLFGEVRPELLRERDLELMHLAGFRELEIGVQTLSAGTGLQAGRRKPARAFLDLAELMIESGIKPIIDFILGLPGDSKEAMLATVDELDTRGLLPYSSFYRLQVLPGTTLREEYLGNGWKFQSEPPYFTLENASSTAEDAGEVYRYLEEEKDHTYIEELSPRVPGGVAVLEAPGDEEAFLSSPYLHTACLVFMDGYPVELLADALSRRFSAHPETFHRSYLYFQTVEPGDAGKILGAVRSLEAAAADRLNGYDRYRFAPRGTVYSKRVEVLLPPSASDALISRLAALGLDLGFYLPDRNGTAGYGERLAYYLSEWGLPSYAGKELEELVG